MEHPTSKVAACPIYFGANGGRFSELGRAILESKDDRLLCGVAFDCGHCSYLAQWVEVQRANGYSVSWECDHCLRVTLKRDRRDNIERVLPGFYQAGRSNLDPLGKDYDPDLPGLRGCTRILDEDDEETGQKAGQECGWETSFLQLVLRRPKPIAESR